MTEDLLVLASDIVIAHLSHNKVASAELPTLIRSTYEALSKLGEVEEPQEPAPKPAVSIRASVKPDHLVCLEDGKKVTMLKRYLMAHFGMTPADYRAKWGLPHDYPMAAPNYAEKRREMAKSIGLGTGKRKAAAPQAAGSEPKKTGRKTLKIAVAKGG